MFSLRQNLHFTKARMASIMQDMSTSMNPWASFGKTIGSMSGTSPNFFDEQDDPRDEGREDDKPEQPACSPGV